MPELMKIRACYPEAVYMNFVTAGAMQNPNREEFIAHLDSCIICPHAVRVAERKKENIV